MATSTKPKRSRGLTTEQKVALEREIIRKQAEQRRLATVREVASIYVSLNCSPTKTARKTGRSVSGVTKLLKMAREHGFLDFVQRVPGMTRAEREAEAIAKRVCPNHIASKRAHAGTKYCQVCLDCGAERTRLSRERRRRNNA